MSEDRYDLEKTYTESFFGWGDNAAQQKTLAEYFAPKIVKYFHPNYVLDVGCGNGNNSRQLASLGFEVLGIDISNSTINEANRLNTYANLKFECIAAEKLSIVNKFDAIICSEVVEHLHQPTPVIKTLTKLLEKDGVLIVTVPNGYGPREVIMTKPMQAAMNNKIAWSVVASAKKLLGFKALQYNRKQPI